MKKIKINNYIYNIILYYLLSLPIIINAALHKNFVAFLCGIFTVWFLSLPIALLPKIAKKYFIFSTLLIYPVYFINFTHYILLQKGVDFNSFITLHATNVSEAKEFFEAFINLKIIFLFVAMIGTIVYCIKKIKPITNESRNKLYIVLGLLLSLFGFWAENKTPNEKLLYRTEFRNFYKYYTITKKDIANMQKLRQTRKVSAFEAIKSTNPKDLKETYVVIIGESANRTHLGIYGYTRDTTPEFSKIKNELYLFDNIKSPHAGTQASLRKVLTFARENDLDIATSKGSIINYFNDAGFKTFWLSNQYDSGPNDNLTSIISHDATKLQFLNKAYYKDPNSSYDEVILPALENALNDKAAKKIIFINIMGSHVSYHLRYPKNFKIFTEEKNERYEKINAYDNSIRYTDFILSQAINLLKKQKNTQSFFLYLSDHAQDVRDEEDSCFCHGDDNNKYSLEIPFILWFNKTYKKNHSDTLTYLKQHLNKEYNTQDVIHTIIWLSGLSNKDFDLSKILGKNK